MLNILETNNNILNQVMNNESTIVISKKSRPIDEQVENKKNGKNKYKNKNKTQVEVEEEIAQLEDQIRIQKLFKQQKNNKTTNKIVQKNKGVLNHLIKLFPDHQQATLQQILQENSYQLQKSIAYVADYVPPDSIPLKAEKPQEVGNKLLNQLMDYDIYGQRLQINGKQFQQLFEEISNLIKEDQRKNGVGIMQINEFIDQCMSAKKVLMLGLSGDLYGDQQICLQEQDPLVLAQTEQFLYQMIAKGNKEKQIRQKQFPSIGQQMNPKAKGKNIVEKINHSIEMDKKQTFNFRPEGSVVRTTPVFKMSNENSIFNIDNRYQSESAMKDLSKQYSHVNLSILRFVYKRFLGDFNMCKSFLEKYYREGKTTIATIKVQKPLPNVISSPKKIKTDPNEYFGQKTMLRSLKDIREEMEHLFKIRQVFKMTRNKIKNVQGRKNLERLANQNLPILNKLSQVSCYKLIEECRSSHPLDVDLHGYREDQVGKILQGLICMIRQQYSNSNLKIITQKRNGRYQTILKVITGFGYHSNVYGRSVLKPAIQNWCKDHHHQCIVKDTFIDIYVSL